MFDSVVVLKVSIEALSINTQKYGYQRYSLLLIN